MAREQMPKDDDASLGGQATFTGGSKRETNPQSLGDQPTFAGGGRPSAPQSLGDELTRGGAHWDDNYLIQLLLNNPSYYTDPNN